MTFYFLVQSRFTKNVKLLDTAKTGKILRDGIKTAIIGVLTSENQPSQSINARKAIVTNIAGTTRDTVEGYINIGINLKLN